MDGLRVDAVASMIYRDYSRQPGEWVPNAAGGNEDDEAIAFLHELNTLATGASPGADRPAEESTAWPGVSRPVESGGLGFTFKWDLGWMHDTLDYFSRAPVHRKHHHGQLTFGLLYAFSENFILPLSHDEVVHGKGSLLTKMPGDRWQQLGNLRALLGHMWAHPGKKLLFMGGELGTGAGVEPRPEPRLAPARAAGARRHPGARARSEPRLSRPAGALGARLRPGRLHWLEADDRAANVLVYARFATDGSPLVCAVNLSPVPREGYRVGLPRAGVWREVLNTDAVAYGGTGLGNGGSVAAEGRPWNEQPWSASITLPPLAALWLVPA